MTFPTAVTEMISFFSHEDSFAFEDLTLEEKTPLLEITSSWNVGFNLISYGNEFLS